MIALVCGGRGYADRAFVFATLDVLKPSAVLNGGAEGADRWAREWASERYVTCTTVEADWKTHGRAAGPIRNRAMLGFRPDLVLAFPGGRGTANMVDEARKAGVPVKIVDVPRILDAPLPAPWEGGR